MTILEGQGARGHQGLNKDQMDYLDLMKDRQVKAYNLVREEDRLMKAKHEKNNQILHLLVNKKPRFEVGDWVLVYDDKSTIAGGGQHVLKSMIIVGSHMR